MSEVRVCGEGGARAGLGRPECGLRSKQMSHIFERCRHIFERCRDICACNHRPVVPYRLPGDALVHACCCALEHAAHIMVTASTSTSEIILCARFGDAMVIRQAAGHLNEACAIVDDGLAAIDTLPGARPAASNCRFEAAGRALFAWHRAAHPAHAVGCRRRRGFPEKMCHRN